MKQVAVTCVFELTYTDETNLDAIIHDVKTHYVNREYLVKGYQEQFNIVQVEEINA